MTTVEIMEYKAVRVLIDSLEGLEIIIKWIEEPLVINLCYRRQLLVRRVRREGLLVRLADG